MRQVQRRAQGQADPRHDHHPQRQASADDKALWDGGDILDPNNGKVYRLRLKPVDGGKKLEVRGYIGAASTAPRPGSASNERTQGEAT